MPKDPPLPPKSKKKMKRTYFYFAYDLDGTPWFSLARQYFLGESKPVIKEEKLR
jgi:hypothetical protein